MKKIAIILFNLGGPDSQEAVKPFLFNLFNDPAIITMGKYKRFILAKFISSKREKKAQLIYKKIGGGSPILRETQSQAKALSALLNSDNNESEYRIFISMRYWHPFSYETIERVKKYSPDEIILLPLYPQYSSTTTGSSLKDWRENSKKLDLTTPTRTICCYPTDKIFIDAHVKLIKEKYEDAVSFAAGNSMPRILFSAHGLPEKTIKAGDPYVMHVEATTTRIVKQLEAEIDWKRILYNNKVESNKLDWRICYQSKVGKLKWVEPATKDEIIIASKANIPLVIVPISFVSEHSETLVELDIEYRDLAQTYGMTKYYRVPALAIEPLFIQALAELCKKTSEHYDKFATCSSEGKRICPKQMDCPNHIYH